MGAFQGSRYDQAQTAPPGTVLLIFSDGLSEARDAQGQEYGEDGLRDFALRNMASSAEALLVIIRALQASAPAPPLSA